MSFCHVKIVCRAPIHTAHEEGAPITVSTLYPTISDCEIFIDGKAATNVSAVRIDINPHEAVRAQLTIEGVELDLEQMKPVTHAQDLSQRLAELEEAVRAVLRGRIHAVSAQHFDNDPWLHSRVSDSLLKKLEAALGAPTLDRCSTLMKTVKLEVEVDQANPAFRQALEGSGVTLKEPAPPLVRTPWVPKVGDNGPRKPGYDWGGNGPDSPFCNVCRKHHWEMCP